MKKDLQSSSVIAFLSAINKISPVRISKCLFTFLFTVCFFNLASSQVIVETFESATWSTRTATTSGTLTVGVNVTSTAAAQTITSYSANNATASATTVTNAPASTGNWTWAYSRASVITATNSQLRKHSANVSFGLASSNSYLITPIITSGVTSITFWVSTSSNDGLYVGLKNNFTGTNSNYPATAGSGTASTVTSNAYAHFTLNSSSITGINGSAQKFTYTYSGNEAVQFAFINNNGSSVSIDDIVITSPPSGPTVASSASNLDFANTTSGSTTTSQNFNVNGSLLTGFPSSLTVTSPSTDFQVSNNDATWGATTTISYTSATLAATPVYVRFSPQSTGAKSGNVTIAGGGATTISVAVSGTGTGIPYEFRSKQSGNWSDASTWEYNNGGWINAVAAPSDADISTLVQAGHIVTINAATSVTNTIVNNGAEVSITTAGTLAIPTGKTVTINGVLTNAAVGNNFTTTGTLSFASTGLYNLITAPASATGIAQIPTATWATGSTCKVAIGATTAPTTDYTGLQGIKQTFSNFVIDAPLFDAKMLLTRNGGTSAPYMAIADSFKVNATGSGTGIQLMSTGNNNNTLSCGTYTQNGGNVYMLHNASSAATRNFTIAGNFVLNSGALYDVANTTGTTVTNINNTNIGGDITVATGATLQRTSAGGAGSIGRIVLNGASVQNAVFNGTVNFAYLDINATVPTLNLNSDLTVNTNGTFTLGASSSLNIAAAKVLTVAGAVDFNSRAVTFKSNNTGTASLGQVTGTVSGASNVTVERYIPGGKRAFRFLAHPFNASMALTQVTDDIDITGNASDAATPPFTASGTNSPSAFSFDPIIANGALNDAGWQAYTSAANTVAAGSGYRVLIRGTKGNLSPATPAAVTINMTGTLNPSGDFVKNLVQGNGGQNFVGNPYVSAINLKSITKSAGVNNGFWIWNPHMGTSGGYMTYSFGTDDYSLPSSGAFFVQTTGPAETITFTEGLKTAVDSFTMLRNSSNKNMVEMTINEGNTLWDRCVLYFNKNGTTAKDKILDADKMYNSQVNFYSLSTDHKALAIDVRPFDIEKSIPIGFVSNVQRPYELTISKMNLDADKELYLKDKYLNVEQKLEAGLTYSFNTNADVASQGENRFELAQRSIKPIVVANSELNIVLAPNPTTDYVQVALTNNVLTETTVSIVTMDGKIVKTMNAGKIQSKKIIINTKELVKGTYMIVINAGNKKTSQKLQVQ